jgi:hypothetical protein
MTIDFQRTAEQEAFTLVLQEQRASPVRNWWQTVDYAPFVNEYSSDENIRIAKRQHDVHILYRNAGRRYVTTMSISEFEAKVIL